MIEGRKVAQRALWDDDSHFDLAIVAKQSVGHDPVIVDGERAARELTFQNLAPPKELLQRLASSCAAEFRQWRRNPAHARRLV